MASAAVAPPPPSAAASVPPPRPSPPPPPPPAAAAAGAALPPPSKPPVAAVTYPPPPPPWYLAPRRPADPRTAPVLTVHPRVTRAGGGCPEKFWRGVREWVDPAPPPAAGSDDDGTRRRRIKGKGREVEREHVDGDRQAVVDDDDEDGAQDGQRADAEATGTGPSSAQDGDGRQVAEERIPAPAADRSQAAAAAAAAAAEAPSAKGAASSALATSSSSPAAAPAPLPSAGQAAPSVSSAPAPPAPASGSDDAAAPSPAPEPSPAPAPRPPAPKPAAKSWAALLRPSASSAPSAPAQPNGSRPAPNGAPSLASPSPPAPASPTGTASAGRPASSRSTLAQLLSAGAAAGELWSGFATSTAGAGGARGKRRVGARGLVNRGNLCFVNSILQVLVFTHEFYNLFALLGEVLPADAAGEYPLIEAMILFLREFPPAAEVAQSGKTAQYPSLPHAGGADAADDAGAGGAFVPEHVYHAMAHIARFDFMRQGRQEDAEEFLGFFLNTLSDEAGGLLARLPREEREAVGLRVDELAQPAPAHEPAPGAAAAAGGGADGWVEIGKKGKGSLVRTTADGGPPTALTRLFTGAQRSTLTIPALPALKPSISIEPFSPLQLDIQPAHVDSLEAALRHLADPEPIHGFALPGGRGTADAVRKSELESLPKVLVCHLKRFGWAEGARKMGKPVAFGEELEVPRECIAPARRGVVSPRYKLFGVVYHHGPTVSSGHYTSAVLSRAQLPSSSAADADDDGGGPQWLHIDDELVTPVAAADVVVSAEAARAGRAGEIGGRERCAYLVFYERVA